MGTNETFSEFYTKFQTHINKLGYPEEDKVDELKTRLNNRFAAKVILGRNDTYDQLVEYCYALDSELRMYDSRRKGTSDQGNKTSKSDTSTTSTTRTSTKTTRVDHATCKLGESTKPLKGMSIAELTDYRKGLPRSATIKQRLIEEKRCARCMQEGHKSTDPDCQFNRLPQSEKFKNDKDNKVSANHVSAEEEEGKGRA